MKEGNKLNDNIFIQVIHSLPGRVRVKLSKSPASAEEMIEMVKSHPGIFEIGFNPISQTTLIKFDTSETTQEELCIRIAVFLSLENELNPVRVYSDTEMIEISDSAFLSGFLIFLSLGARMLPQTRGITNILDWIAGIGTAYSIVEHGYEEFKEKGSYDPEVLSVIYLLTSFSQGKLLSANIISWIATYGRHFARFTSKNVEIKPRLIPSENGQDKQYEVIINPLNSVPQRKMLFKFLPMVIMNAASGGKTSIEGTLFDEIRKVATDHGDVLEGFGKFKDGIPIRIQYNKN